MSSGLFEEFVRRVVEHYGGRVTVVLFGSRARGATGPLATTT
ncbi:MAG: hypothetical protein ACK4SY_08965 [Pyrobaculum sp.]